MDLSASDRPICLQLDEVLLRFMDQLELLEEKRGRLNSLIEQGWFSMSKARYSMGNKQVSALQYGSEMEPLVRVHDRTLANGEAQFHTQKITWRCTNDLEKESYPVESIGPQEEGVRRRTNAKKDSAAEDEDKNPALKAIAVGSSSKPSVSDHNPQQDPLKWFGILVPQSLKQAQSLFKQVIELSAEIAALQSAVLKTRGELQLCLKDKHQKVDKSDAAITDID